MTSVPFIHLRTHSAFSLAEGALKIPDIIKLCQQYNMPAVAVTDTNNLFGAMEFSLAAQKAGIQPLIGCQLSVKPDKEDPRYQTLSREGEIPLDHVVLYVQNQKGYQNLLKLASEVYSQDPRYLPHIPFQLLETHHEGLICLSGGRRGGVSQLLQKGFRKEAHDYFKRLRHFFENRFYIEIERFGEPSEAELEPVLLEMAYAEEIPVVATNEAFFATKEMYEAHDTLLCIAQGAYKSEEDRFRLTADYRFKSPREMASLFEDLPEALANTIQIAKRCAFMVEPKEPMLPPFPTPKGEDEEIRDQAIQGLEKRLQEEVYHPDHSESEKETIKKQYFDRLEYELGIIQQMGFSGYFLIVGDFIQWAKRQNIPVGPGRGSGAGSLVAWSLTITNVDPIRFNLIFERFLNPERVSMPDFDIDFCQERRDEVIDYVRERYGNDHVAQIITFGKLQARAVVKDVGRVLGMPYGKVDEISKLIPNNPANPVTLKEALIQEPEILLKAENDSDIKTLLDIAVKLEGLYRHASTHAAGIVIGGQPIDEIVALYRDHKAAISQSKESTTGSTEVMPATQFHMKHVEMAGLVKFDFLGLKTLTVIKRAEELLKMRGIEVDAEKIPLDDNQTFEFLKEVNTVGVFQLESAGMRDVIKRLKPGSFEEIIALVALYRPGPMDDIPRYLSCKHGEEEVNFLHPLLEEILKETYGVMVYQEQVMQIAQVMAGYSLGGADMLRRAMGKKIKSEMDAQRSIFMEGALKNGVKENIARQVFDQAAKFAGYGFNKCHSTPYALIAYQTAYLKANHPVDFMAASMTYDINNTDRLSLFRQDLIKMGIEVLPPDVNKSYADFRVEDTGEGKLAVRYALAGIKSVGFAAAEEVIREREKAGPFKSPLDFAKRLDTRVMNKRFLEKLIGAGGFDSLHPNRAQLMASVDQLISLAGQAKKDRQSNQTSLFGGGDANSSGIDLPVTLKPTKPWTTFERLNKELEAIGFYLSAHPLDSYSEALDALKLTRSIDLKSVFEKGDVGSVSVAGVVLSKKERLSKSGNKYAFVQFSDASGEFEVTMFSEMLSQIREELVPGVLLNLTVTGRVEDDTLRLTVQAAGKLDTLIARMKNEVSLRISQEEALKELKALLDEIPKGQSSLRLILPCFEKEALVLELPHRLSLGVQTLERIKLIEGIELLPKSA